MTEHNEYEPTQNADDVATENPKETTSPETAPPPSGNSVLEDLLKDYAQPMTVTEDDPDTSAPGGDDDGPTGTLNKDGTPRKRRGRKSVKDLPNMDMSGSIITGSMFLFFADLVIPFAIEMLHNWKSKDKIDGELLKIPKEQMKELEKLADAVVKQLNINGNPLALLIFGWVTIYGINYAQVRQLSKMQKGV